MAKRLLSIALALLMIFNVFAVAVSAADSDKATITLATDNANPQPGDIVDVTVSLKTTYPVYALQMMIAYDTDYYEVVGDATGLLASEPAEFSSVTDSAALVAAAKEENIGVDANLGLLRLGYTWLPSEGAKYAVTFDDETAVASFRLKVKDYAPTDGKGIIKVDPAFIPASSTLNFDSRIATYVGKGTTTIEDSVVNGQLYGNPIDVSGACFGGSEVVTAAADITTVISKSNVKADDIVTVTVKLSTNYYVSNIQLPVLFDKTQFEVVGTKTNRNYLTFGEMFTSRNYNFGGRADQQRGFEYTSDADTWNTDSAKAQYGVAYITVAYDGGIGNDDMTFAKPQDDVVATFQLKALKNVADTSESVFVSTDWAKTAENKRGYLTVGMIVEENYDPSTNTEVDFDNVTYTSETVAVVGVTVSGTVQTSGASGETVIELISSDSGEVAYSTTVAGTGSKEYKINNVLPGTYTAQASKANHITRTYNITVGNDNVTQNIVLGARGDVNADGVVDIIDVSKANAHAKNYVILSGYALTCADVNGDTKVNTIDVARLHSHTKGASFLHDIRGISKGTSKASDVTVTIAPEESISLRGNIMTYTVALSYTGTITSFQMELGMPEGLTYVDESGLEYYIDSDGYEVRKNTVMSDANKALGFDFIQWTEWSERSDASQGECMITGVASGRAVSGADNVAIATFDVIITDDCDLTTKEIELKNIVFGDGEYCAISEENIEVNSESVDVRDHFCTDYIVEVKAIAPTCYEDGVIAHYACELCNTRYTDALATEEIFIGDVIIPTAGHDYKAVVTPPTLTEQGYTTYTCENCGDSYVADPVLSSKVILTVTPDKTTAYPGDEITYTVTMKSLSALTSMAFGTVFPDGLTYVDNSGAVDSGLKTNLHLDNVDWYEWSERIGAVRGENRVSGYASKPNTVNEAVVCTFKATVDDDASGEYAVTLNSLDEFMDDNWEIFDEEDVYVASTPVNVTEKAPVYFRPSEGTTTVIDEDMGIIYGLEEGIEDLEDFVEYSGGTLEYIETENGFGTGTVVNFIVDGEVYESYSIVIRGDVNGDGFIDSYDAVIISQMVMETEGYDLNTFPYYPDKDYEIEYASPEFWAADVNYDGALFNTFDLSLLFAHQNGDVEIPQIFDINMSGSVDEDVGATASVTTKLDCGSIRAGEELTVKVYLDTNYYVGNVQLPVIYDKTQFELVGFAEGDEFITFNENTSFANGLYLPLVNAGIKSGFYYTSDPEWREMIDQYDYVWTTLSVDPRGVDAELVMPQDELFFTFKLKALTDVDDTTESVFVSPDWVTNGYINDGVMTISYSETKDNTDPRTFLVGGIDYQLETVVEGCAHNYKSVVTPPTCTEQGYTTYTCTICGDSYVADYVEELGHKPGTEVKENITATSYDLVVYCSVCNKELSRRTVVVSLPEGKVILTVTPDKTEANPGDVITYTVTMNTDYALTAMGFITSFPEGLTYVDGSGALNPKAKELLNSDDIEWVEWSRRVGIGAKEGENKFQAIASSPKKVSEIVLCTFEASVDNGASGEYTVELTGLVEFMDSDWNEIDEEDVKVVSTPVKVEPSVEPLHDYKAVVTAPTCTEQGYTTYTCTICGDSYTADVTPAKGHKPGTAVKENITATSYDSVVYCSVCNKELSRETIDITPVESKVILNVTPNKLFASHNEVITYTVTMNADCALTSMAFQTSFPEGLTYVDGSGAVDPNAKKALNCDDLVWVEWSERVGMGAAQGENKFQAIASRPNKVSEIVLCTFNVQIDEDADLGEYVVNLTGLDEFMDSDWEVISENEVSVVSTAVTVIDHTCTGKLIFVEGKDATCTEDGVVAHYVCDECGKQYIDADATEEFTGDVVIPATGHDEGKWVIVNKATCTEKGLKELRCTVCDKVLNTAVIPAPGHTPAEAVKENEIPATFDKEGSYDSVVYCTACGEEISRVPVVVPAIEVLFIITPETTKAEPGDIVTYTVAMKWTDYISSFQYDVLLPEGLTFVSDSGKIINETASLLKFEGYYFDEECFDGAYRTSGYGSRPVMLPAGYDSLVLVEFQVKVDENVAIGETFELDLTKIDCGDENFDEIAGIQFMNSDVLEIYEHVCSAYTTSVENTIAPKCEEEGSYDLVVRCSECGEEISRTKEIIPPTGHKEGKAVRENEVPSTCVKKGSYDLVVYCSECGEEISRTTIEIGYVPHTFGDETIEKVVAATCTKEGSYDSVFYCTVCGKELERETIKTEKLPHNFEWVTDKDSTCTETGTKHEKCTACDATRSLNTVIAKKPHNIQKYAAVAPTCTKVGNIEYYLCLVCGKCFTDEACTNEISVFEAMIPAKGHDVVIDKAVAPTCTETGLTEGSHCAVCETVIKAQEVIPALGHKPGEEVRENEIPATCTVDGSFDVVTYCTVCGNETSRKPAIIPAPGHNYEGVVTPPTIESEGYTTYTCTRCGDFYLGDFVDKLTGFAVGGTVTSFGEATEIVTITLTLKGETEPAYTTTVTGNSAEYSFGIVAIGEYTMSVSKKNHVTRTYDVTVSDDAVTTDAKIHLRGDVTGDGKVNTIDVARVNAHARGVSKLDDYIFQCGDVTGDGKVNTIDVARVNAHARGVTRLW